MAGGTNGVIPRDTSSTDNSLWTMDGSHQRLAEIAQKDHPVLTFRSSHKTRTQKYLIASVIIIVILILALSISIYLVTVPYVLSQQVCNSKQCIRSASNILLSMNESVDPCDNFFKFACGNWRNEHPGFEPFHLNNWFINRNQIFKRDLIEFLTQPNSDDEPLSVHQARLVYESCRDFESMEVYGLQSLSDALERLGLNVNPFNATRRREQGPFNWVRSLALTRRFLSLDLLIGSGVMASTRNSSRNQLVVATAMDDEPLPGWSWDTRSVIQASVSRRFNDDDEDESSGSLQKVVKIWSKYGAPVISAVIGSYGDDFDDEQVERAALTILYMLRNISAMEKAENVTGSILNEIPVDLSLYELQDLLDSSTSTGSSRLNLTEYFLTLYEDFENVSLNFEADTILVYKKPYFEMLAQYLEDLDDQDIELLIWWHVVYALASHTNEDLKDVKQIFVEKIMDGYPSEPRASGCMKLVYHLMQPAVGYYIMDKVDENRVSEIYLMLDYIKATFSSFVLSLKWMDQTTIDRTLAKLESIKSFVGVPDWMYNKTEMSLLYEDVTLDESTHLENILNLVSYQAEESLLSLRSINNHSNADFDPLDINAYYIPTSNTITVPYGILQFPFHDLGLDALNYGAIGSVLGHEFTHALDNIGRQYDQQGNVLDWWSPEAVEMFTNKTLCFVDEYNDFHLPFSNITTLKIDGDLTLGENLADDGGLIFALDAYRNMMKFRKPERHLPGLQRFTHEQLFFLAFAGAWCSEYSLSALIEALEDEHSPDFARVLVVLQNSQEFSSVWNCRKGTFMNPEKKCHLWS